MKKEYIKPEISANTYAEFENVLTWGCTKQFKNSPPCEASPDWKPGGGNTGITGQSDFPCKADNVLGMEHIGS